MEWFECNISSSILEALNRSQFAGASRNVCEGFGSVCVVSRAVPWCLGGCPSSQRETRGSSGGVPQWVSQDPALVTTKVTFWKSHFGWFRKAPRLCPTSPLGSHPTGAQLFFSKRKVYIKVEGFGDMASLSRAFRFTQCWNWAIWGHVLERDLGAPVAEATNHGHEHRSWLRFLLGRHRFGGL